MTPELLTHLAQEDRLQAYFEARPFQLATHDDLVNEVGENYRSRISPLRKRGLVIENVPAFKADGTRGYGSYRFRPAALGRDADTPVIYADAHIGPLFENPGGYQR